MKKIAITTCLFLIASAGFGQVPITSEPFVQHGDHIFIKVSIDNSEPLDFILDTGDGLTVLDLNVAKDLNLDLKKIEYHESVQGLISGAVIKHNTIAINEFLMEKNIKVYATTLNHLEISIGRNVDGIVGWDLLWHHPVKLNYDTKMIEIFAQGKLPAERGEGLDFEFESSIPVIKANFELNNGEKKAGTFFINTGAGTTMDFNTPYARANDVIHKTGEHYSYVIKGIGKDESRHYEGRVKSFSFGTFKFENLPIGISDSNQGLQGNKKVSGIIGNRILRQFNTTFDYENKKVYFQKNASFGQPVPVNCSGIDVQLNKEQTKVLIHQVYDESPGKKAGIQVNDILVGINGKNTMDLGLIRVEEMLKEPGKTVELMIDRGGEKITVNLKLSELI